jgi:hypothetical protein
MGAAFGAQVSNWTHWITIGLGYGIGVALLVIATVLITRSYFSEQSGRAVPAQASGTVPPGIPTLSALLGQNSTVEFNAKQHFALAYYSPITAEVEKNIKIVAQKDYPNDKEAFYARFIGTGLIVYQYDWTWFMIYGSQLLALTELNSRGMIPIADLQKHYDAAVVEYPKTYEKYSFEQWIDFMKTRLLVSTYPSQMIELSWGGKDFLRYLAHCGRDINVKAN